jgi:hypothetical protein
MRAMDNYFTTPKPDKKPKSNMIFSCGVGENERRLIPEKYWHEDKYGCHSFKMNAPVYCWFIEDNKRVFKQVTGLVIFLADGSDFWGGERARNFRSKVYENPTYRSLMGAAQASQKVTRDYHHQFIEGCYFKGVEEVDGKQVTILRMSFGS